MHDELDNEAALSIYDEGRSTYALYNGGFEQDEDEADYQNGQKAVYIA